MGLWRLILYLGRSSSKANCQTSSNFAAVKKLLSNPWLSALLVLVIASLISVLYFQELMLTPGEKSPTFGGDGLTIHYNLQYHATYGEGAYLTSQYHPYAESVFMTDAHALLAVVFAWLRPVFPGLAPHASGIANALIFWSTPIAVLFLFLTFRSLKVRWSLSLVFGLLIALMSPQILRQLGGQYTLGFTWLLPYVIWYVFTWNDGKRYLLKSLVLTTTIYLLGLNNPYLYAIAGAFLLAISGLATLLKLSGNQAISWQQILYWLGVFLGSTAAVFLTLEYFDLVDDRVEVPFGFFHNIANWGGLLSSQDVLLYDWIHRVFPGLATPKYEHQLYLGLIPMLTAISLPLLLFVPRIKKQVTIHQQPLLLISLLGGLAGLIFGFGLPFSYFKYWTYDHLGAVLQFRAPVRFGWPFYYLLGIAAGFTLNKLYANQEWRKWARPLVLCFVLVWAVEVHQFLRGHLEDRLHGNSFRPERLDDFKTIAREAGIDTASFSSIFLLPTELGWTDKVHHNGTWRSNHDGYSLSLATGLPLLNGKLSRLSLERCLQSLQVTTHPLVEKQVLDKIHPTKDILLLAAPDKNLDPPERRLRELGTSLYQSDELELLSLSPTILRDEHTAAVAAIATDTLLTTDYNRFAYEYNKDQAFFGAGSQRVGKFWQDVFKLPVDSLRGSGPYDVSFWVYTDGRRFGGPKFYLKLEDEKGAKVTEQYQWTNRVYETQRGWQRVAFSLEVPPEAALLKLISDYDHPYYVDEVLVRPAATNVLIEGPNGRLYNNYWVE